MKQQTIERTLRGRYEYQGTLYTEAEAKVLLDAETFETLEVLSLDVWCYDTAQWVEISQYHDVELDDLKWFELIEDFE